MRDFRELDVWHVAHRFTLMLYRITGDFPRQIAFGSANELDCELLIARDLGYLPEQQYKSLMRELSSVKKMLARFIQTIERKNQTFEAPEMLEV